MCLGFLPISLFAVSYGDAVTVNGKVSWDDNNDVAGVRPSEVELEVYVDGDLYETVTAAAADGWEFSFALDDYMDYNDGKASAIDVRLVSELPNYATSIADPVVSIALPSIEGGWDKEEPYSKNFFIQGRYFSC